LKRFKTVESKRYAIEAPEICNSFVVAASVAVNWTNPKFRVPPCCRFPVIITSESEIVVDPPRLLK
jgi:hypothetical protein